MKDVITYNRAVDAAKETAKNKLVFSSAMSYEEWHIIATADASFGKSTTRRWERMCDLKRDSSWESALGIRWTAR